MRGRAKPSQITVTLTLTLILTLTLTPTLTLTLSQVLLREGFVATLLSNSLYAAAFSWYRYHSLHG